MQGSPPFPSLDLRPSLFAAKEGGGYIYHPNDTHWNDAGAYVAYQEIVTALRPEFDRLDAVDRDRIRFNIRNRAGDLAAMIDMTEYLRCETPVVEIAAKTAVDGKVDPQGVRLQSNSKLYAKECPGSNAPRAVIFHDSFGLAVVPFLEETFRRTVVGYDVCFSEVLVEREKPDVVIQLPELGLGLVPGAGGTVSVTRRIGRRRTAWLVLTSTFLDAPTALRWGLVDAITATAATA